jgi:hypothetical protein
MALSESETQQAIQREGSLTARPALVWVPECTLAIATSQMQEKVGRQGR